MATDAAGNSYTAGHFWGTARFAGLTLVSQGFEDIYLAKYDPQGGLLWLRQAGGVGHEDVLDLAVDAAGNVVLTGSFYSHNTSAPFSTISFGSTTLTGGSTFYEMFLARYDPQGTLRWAQQTVSQPQSIGCVGTEVALDTRGNVYVGGYYDGPARFSSATIPSATPSGLFLAKYNAQGQLAWLRTGLGNRDGAVAFDFLQLAVSPSDDVYLLCR